MDNNSSNSNNKSGRKFVPASSFVCSKMFLHFVVSTRAYHEHKSRAPEHKTKPFGEPHTSEREKILHEQEKTLVSVHDCVTSARKHTQTKCQQARITVANVLQARDHHFCLRARARSMSLSRVLARQLIGTLSLHLCTCVSSPARRKWARTHTSSSPPASFARHFCAD